MQTIPMMMNRTTTRSFRHDDQNSSSAYPRVPKTVAIWPSVWDFLQWREESTYQDDDHEDGDPCSERYLICPVLHGATRHSLGRSAKSITG